MPTLQDVVSEYLESNNLSIRALAKATDISYPTLLGVVNRGSIPRKQAYRLALRRELGWDEDEWEDLLAGNATDQPGQTTLDPTAPTLQELVSRNMYARGMTEQELAEDAGVAYSTVMGITRKMSIPREDSLNRIVDLLALDPEQVQIAIGTSRALRRGTPRDDDEPDVPHLAELVARHIKNRGQSVGAFAQDLGIGYFRIAKFLDTGVPPEDETFLEPLRRMLGVEPEVFEEALQKSAEHPEPADLDPPDDLLGEDANPLQEAMVSFMREHGLTLKALAKRADLSQVTVSRLVKQGQMPTRATTHIKLQELLGISANEYQVISSKARALSVGHALLSNDSEEREVDDYEPDEHHYEPQPITEFTDPEHDAHHNAPSQDELIELVKKLGPKQREALKTFLAAMV